MHTQPAFTLKGFFRPPLGALIAALAAGIKERILARFSHLSLVLGDLK